MNRFVKKSKHKDPEAWSFNVVKKDDQHLSRVSYQRESHITWLFIGFIAILLILFVRLLYVNLVYREQWQDWADNNYLRVFRIPAPRGLIFDRTGKQLVENVSENVIYVIPADIPTEETERKFFLEQLAFILEISLEDLTETVYKQRYSFSPLEIANGVTHNQIVAIEEIFKNTPAVFSSQKSIRQYIDDYNYSHVLGYVAPLNENNIDEYLEQGYTWDERIGVLGIEKEYESILHGTPSKRVIEINAQGSIVNEKTFSQSIPGKSLKLTLIDDLQTYIVNYLRTFLRSNGKNGGVVIVGNPQNGEIYSLVSMPLFDNNMFADGLKTEEEIQRYQSYLEDDARPLLNKTIGGLYSPGSTYKIITASAVLGFGEIDEETLIDSPGSLSIQDKYDPQKTYIYRDWKSDGHGEITIIDALAESSNTFFYTTTGGFGDYNGIGVEELIHYSDLYFLGKKTGIDLPGELDGLVPSPTWKLDRRGSTWFTGDTYNMAIGQGYLLTTPLQVYAYTATIANDGQFVTPHLSEEAVVYSKSIDVDQHTIDIVQQGLRRVVAGEKGTARSLQSFPVELAGKTGTAQFNNNQQKHAWFVAYGPFEDPEVAITVLIEDDDRGSSIAVPVARDILYYYFENKEQWGL